MECSIDFKSLPFPYLECHRSKLLEYKELAIAKEKELNKKRQFNTQQLNLYVTNHLKEIESKKSPDLTVTKGGRDGGRFFPPLLPWQSPAVDVPIKKYTSHPIIRKDYSELKQKYLTTLHQPIDSQPPMRQPIFEDTSLNQAIDNSLENPVNQPIDNPVNQPINIPVHQPIDIPVHQPIDIPVHQPMDTPVHQQVNNSVYPPMDNPVNLPMDNPVHQPMDNPVHQPTDSILVNQPVVADMSMSQPEVNDPLVNQLEDIVPKPDNPDYQPNQQVNALRDPPIKQSENNQNVSPVNVPVYAPFEQPVSIPINQAVTTPINQPVTAPMNQPINTPMNRPVTAPMNQPVKTQPAINQPVTTPINEFVNVPIHQPVNAPVNQPVNAPIDRPVTAPMYQVPLSSDKPINRTAVSRKERLFAIIKGYLTRRLLKTEKVSEIVMTIKDGEKLLKSLTDPVSSLDIELRERVTHQLRVAKSSLHKIFFSLPAVQQMKYISHSRSIRMEKRFKQLSKEEAKMPRLSSATMKSLERKQQVKLLSSTASHNHDISVRSCSSKGSVDSSISQGFAIGNTKKVSTTNEESIEKSASKGFIIEDKKVTSAVKKGGSTNLHVGLFSSSKESTVGGDICVGSYTSGGSTSKVSIKSSTTTTTGTSKGSLGKGSTSKVSAIKRTISKGHIVKNSTSKGSLKGSNSKGSLSLKSSTSKGKGPLSLKTSTSKGSLPPNKGSSKYTSLPTTASNKQLKHTVSNAQAVGIDSKYSNSSGGAYTSRIPKLSSHTSVAGKSSHSPIFKRPL